MIGWVVAIGGPPGSGKSTAGRLVARELGLEYRSVGEEFRAQAKERGMDLDAFDRYAEAHPEVDQDLDRRMLALARPGRVIDGRIQGVLCRRNGIPVRSIVVTAAEAERVRRLAGRDDQSEDVARSELRAREASERARFAKFYGIDLDREVPDLTVDSTHRPAEEVARTIVDFLRDRSRVGAPG